MNIKDYDYIKKVKVLEVAVNREHAFRRFNSDIKKSDFPPVVFLHGEEMYLIDWAAESLINRYVNPAAASVDLIKPADETCTVDYILESCNTFPLFSSRKVVWVKDFPLLKSDSAKGFSAADKDRLSAYLKNPSQQTLLIFSICMPGEKNSLAAELKKKAAVYDFDTLDRATFRGFIEKRFRAEGVQVNRDIVDFLVDETGYYNKESDYRLYNLVNDIKKIVALSGDSKITEDTISEVLNGDLNKFAFDFLDAAAGNKKDTAFEMLHSILTADSDIYKIIGLLVNHFELILEVKEFKEDGLNLTAMEKILKIHQFRIKKAMGFADKFTVQKLKNILCSLYEIDRSIKTGAMDGSMALELMVGRI